MKIRLAVIVGGAIATILISGCSSTHQMNPTPDEQKNSRVSQEEAQFNQERIKQENYDRGMKDGIKRGYDEAIRVITKEYLPYIKRLEAGKYAMKKGYVTPPEIMVFQNPNGVLSYRATGCKIEKELDVNDIFNKFGSNIVSMSGDYRSEHQNKDTDTQNPEAYQIASRDEISLPVTRPDNRDMIMVQTIDKTAQNKLILDEYNANYSEKDGKYIATFASPSEMKSFCSQYHICSEGN